MQLSQIQAMALKVIDRSFGPKNLFSDLGCQRAADTYDPDSGLTNRGGNGGNRVFVRSYL